MFAAVIKLARRKDRKENPHAVLVPGGMAGTWICGGLGFAVVFIGIIVSLVPPGDSSNKLGFEIEAGWRHRRIRSCSVFFSTGAAPVQKGQPDFGEVQLARDDLDACTIQDAIVCEFV